MKSVFALLVLLTATNATLIEDIATEHGAGIIARTISDILIDKLVAEIKSGRIVEIIKLERQEPVPIFIPITLPPLPDPISLPSLELPMNISLPNITTVLGDLSFCAPEVKGLSAIDGQLNVTYHMLDTKILTLELDLKLPQVEIDSVYKADISFEILTSPGNITGEGNFTAGFEEFFFKLMAEGKVALTTGERLSLDKLDVDLGFTKFLLDGENAMINGEIVDLSMLAESLTGIFNAIWKDPLKGTINEMIRCSIDHVINDCVPLDLLGGVYSCLKIELNPACFGTSGKLPVSFLEFVNSNSKGTLAYCDAFQPTESSSILPSDGTAGDTTTAGSTGGVTGSTAETSTSRAEIVTSGLLQIFFLTIFLTIKILI